MKRLLALIAIAGLIAAASPGRTHYYDPAPNATNDAYDGATYWTIFDNNLDNSNGKSSYLKINDTNTRNATANWALAGGGDYVAGTGWGGSSTPKSVSYTITRFDTRGQGTVTFGIYGWSCNVPAGNDNVEFYVVDRWAGVGTFVPPGKYMKKDSVVPTDDGKGPSYQLYDSGSRTGPNRCGEGQSFKQVWAVNLKNQNATPETRTIPFGQLFAPMAKLGYLKTPYPYLVVGVEGVDKTSGTVTFSSSRTD